MTRSDIDLDAALRTVGKLAPVDPADFGTRELRLAARQQRRLQQALRRSRWWYPLALVLSLFAITYSVLRTDQQLAAVLVWPTQGAQFVEVGDSAADPEYRDTMVIVAGGLNRKSGNLIAAALFPTLGGPDARVFSLIYGSGIYDEDINAKFDELFDRYHPNRLVLYGSSMGGDVVLNIAEHFQRAFTDPAAYPENAIVPAVETIYLDCSPLGTDDVRYSARAKADFLTGLTERLGTDGGAMTRLVAEMLAQRKQWSTGSYPFISLKAGDFAYKWDEVWREKLNPTGVSTALVKDQYGVIRRFDPDIAVSGLTPGTDIAYLRPDVPENDNTIDVARVESELRPLAADADLDLTVLQVPGGSHASAARDADVYNGLITEYQRQAILFRISQILR